MARTSDLRITLDGSGGLVSNVSQHSGKRGSFVVFRDVITDVANRIVKRDGTGASLGSVAGTEIQILHEYVYVDTNGASNYYWLGAIDSGSYIYASTDGGATWAGQTLPITPTAGGRWFFLNADNRVFAVNGKDAMIVGVQTSANTLTWRKAGQAAPTAAATYSLTTNDTPYNTGTISVTQGSSAAVGIGTAWTTGAAWVGKVIAINGVNYTIATVTTGTAMTFTENFKEATNAYAYNVFRGVGDWLTGPRYCYAYRNSATGHLSNVSPVMEVTEQNQFGRTITLTIAGSAENTTAYNNGYDQIQLFRSAKNAYTLVALNEYLANNGAGSAITYVETAVKFADTYLTDLQAPFTKNGVPPTGLSCLAFHQNRVWGLRPSDGRYYLTLALHESNYGVVTEAWPIQVEGQLFSRFLPEASGFVIVGNQTSATESLIVQTPRGDYAIEGVNPFTFNAVKIATRRSGGFLYSATDVDGQLVQFYRDKRLLAFPGGDDVGIAIQDKLSLVRDSLLSKVRLFWFAAKNRNFLLLSVPASGASTANDYTYVFDLDKGALAYEWNLGFSAFATVHDATTGELRLIAGTPGGAVYRLLGGATQDAGANFQPVIKTSILRPMEDDSWAELAYVHLYVNDASGTWTGRVFIHEQTNTGATDGTVTAITFRAAPAKSQPAQGKLLVATFTHSKRMRSNAFQVEVTLPSQNAVLWIEKLVLGFKTAEERVA